MPARGWKNLLYWQLRLLGWKAAGLEAFAALALYSVGRALGLWEAAWSLRNALFGLTALAMCTALLGLPFLCRASQYRMLELERATHAGIGTPLVLRFLLLLAGEVVLLAVLAISVYAAAPLKLGQLVCLLAVPFCWPTTSCCCFCAGCARNGWCWPPCRCLLGNCACCA